MTTAQFTSFAIANSIRESRMESFEYRHLKAVEKIETAIAIAAGNIKMEWRTERRSKIGK